MSNIDSNDNSKGHPARGDVSLSWCSLPLLSLATIAALDSADKSLLGASFPILEKMLHLDVQDLGYFSLSSNLSYSLALPFWSFLVHRLTINRAHDILAAACCLWGWATVGIGCSSIVVAQILFRCLNGWALASILPLSQTILVEMVPQAHLQGRAFGLIGFMEKAAATLAVACVVGWEEGWRYLYVGLGILSLVMALVARKRLQVFPQENFTSHAEEQMPLVQIVRRIAGIPAFLCLIAQGVFGAIPWDMMSFLLLFYEWKGFSKQEIIWIQVSTGISGTIGGVLGGILGDYFIQRHRLGRIAVAFTSVVGGIVFYRLFLFSASFEWAFWWSNMFHLLAPWTPAGAIRPLCAQLAQNSSERAQIVAFWILLEKTSAAIFGAPLVGYLTKRYLTKHMLSMQHENNVGVDETRHIHIDDASEKAELLAHNMFWLSCFFWTICAVFWLLMARFLKDPPKALLSIEQKSLV